MLVVGGGTAVLPPPLVVGALRGGTAHDFAGLQHLLEPRAQHLFVRGHHHLLLLLLLMLLLMLVNVMRVLRVLAGMVVGFGAQRQGLGDTVARDP